jgi:hypothetical protein
MDILSHCILYLRRVRIDYSPENFVRLLDVENVLLIVDLFPNFDEALKQRTDSLLLFGGELSDSLRPQSEISTRCAGHHRFLIRCRAPRAGMNRTQRAV